MYLNRQTVNNYFNQLFINIYFVVHMVNIESSQVYTVLCTLYCNYI